ncbi:hypothetical protein [Oceanobacillus kimchii]|uniref:hypothetical protein n=1 Tax=Oceanobacillus kimchii TaxID=746691 RepID=UPI003C74557F
MSIDITIDYLLIQLGLYEPLTLDETNIEEIENFIRKTDNLQFDCYCIECQKDSTFKFHKQNSSLRVLNFNNYPQNPFNRIISSEPIDYFFKCQRDEKHLYAFSFLVRSNKLTKIGQYPSIADLELHSIEKYRKILSKDYRDFSKAIGLNSHGIGAGSFVYLRRIFENLIEESRHIAIQDKQFDDNQYQRSRMDDKIELLSNYLPDILVENRKIYAILSRGIHELSENECLDMFPKVKLAIELILDEKLHEQEKQSKIKTVKDFVATTISAYKS